MYDTTNEELLEKLKSYIRDRTVYKHFCCVCKDVDKYCAFVGRCKNYEQIIQAYHLSETFI